MKFIELWAFKMLNLELSVVWPKKNRDFMKKIQQLRKTLIHFSFEHMKGDHSKQLKPCLYVVQSYRFQIEIVIVEKICFHQHFDCLPFPPMKNKPIKNK